MEAERIVSRSWKRYYEGKNFLPKYNIEASDFDSESRDALRLTLWDYNLKCYTK